MRRPPSRLRLVADRDEPLLRFVARRSGIAEQRASDAIRRGSAFVRGRRERDPLAQVRKGDKVEVSLREPGTIALSRESILHLDQWVLAVNKPDGVAAQEDLEGGAALPALCGELLAAVGERETQALLVHRLDRATTGVTLLARTRAAQAALLEEFRERRARKEYRALAAGAPAQDEFTVDEPVAGRSASTRFRVLERLAGAISIAAFPETGRTHQVRLHLQHAGCPLLGDKLHGGAAFLTRPDGSRLDVPRPMLHALSLTLRHPARGELRVAAPLPRDFDEALRWLRG